MYIRFDFKMAAGDTALWLHNKLGSTDDLWSGQSICSQLTHEKLINIQECFHALQSHVKVKLLLSFLHIPMRNIEQWRVDLEEIISLGMSDPDPWVATVGENLREYPSTGALLLVDQDSRVDSSMITCLEEMKNLAKKSTVTMLPLECQYLNKSALGAVAGQLPEPSNHFKIKRRPKSAALRAEIIQKSSETVLNKRNHASSSVPIKSRSFAKKLDITPLKMTPGRSPISGSDFRSPSTPFGRSNSLTGRSPITPLAFASRSSASKKDSKIKLLEIEEMPVGAKEAKRRKKIADLEALEAQKKEKEAAASAAAAANPVTSSLVTSPSTPYTPDYAVGLKAPATPKMPITVLSVSTTALPQPSPAYLPSMARQNNPVTTLSGVGSLSSSTQAASKQNLSEQLKQQLLQPQVRPSVPASVPMMPPILIAQHPTASPTAATPTTATAVTGTIRPVSAVPPTAVVRPQQTILMQQPALRATQPQLLTVTTPPPVQAQAGAVKKGLSLTKDQMYEAQEMFKASNKVSRPEKALILGFMAGSRENPCPQQGDVLNIKLSEKEEVLQLPDGTEKKKIEDTYFQMNYATGEWKRFIKVREVSVS